MAATSVLNTVTNLIGNPTYGKTGGSYANSVPELRKWEKTLMVMLNVGKVGKHKEYMIHKTIEKGLGDTINIRRYLGLEADPDKLKLDKNTITGPELKELNGQAVEFRLEWFGNGVEYNDVLAATHIDDIVKLVFPRLTKNAAELMDNIAAKALYSGASKVYVKTYTPATGAVELGAAASDVAGNLNINVLRWVTQKMINNVETIKSATEDVVIPATIEPLSGGRYKVLLSANGMDDLLDDTQFLDKFVKGLSAQELRNNAVTNIYRLSFETIDNYLTVRKTAGGTPTTAIGTPQVNRSGELEVAFVLGKEFAADVTMNDQSVRLMNKNPDQVDTGDKYGRLGFVTYKFAYNASVINSKAIYAVVFQPGNALVTGTATAPATSVPA